MEIHGMTIDKFSGKTYWQKRQSSIEALKTHVKRYSQRACHLAIYKIETGNSELEFVEHISNFNLGEK
jgi:hypothetical protein